MYWTPEHKPKAAPNISAEVAAQNLAGGPLPSKCLIGFEGPLIL